MITELALKEAIAEVQGKRNPDRQDCMMLAAFYTIQDRLYPELPPTYSSAGQPPTSGVYGDSEFLQAVSNTDPAEAWSVMDELMDSLKVINERLYNCVMRKLR